MNNPVEEESVTFEGALAELQQVVSELERGTSGLETSLQAYERGIRLLRHCHHYLEQAEQRIEILTGFGRNGTPLLTSFDSTSTMDKHLQIQQQETAMTVPATMTVSTTESHDATLFPE